MENSDSSDNDTISAEPARKVSKMICLTPDQERHLVGGVVAPHDIGPGEQPLDEIASLVEAAGALVVGKLVQRRANPHPRTYFGKGKLAELVELVGQTKPDTVVIDHDIKPAQLTHLEEAVGCKVIDRSEVILDIFANRARTHQAQLQVLLAQMQYQLPRLGRLWTHLERLGGGIGTRGPGESQIETDRRLLRLRIQAVRDELLMIEGRRKQEVDARSEEYTTSLVGYTNAGKSTLMNALAGSDTFVKDMLFATLDTLTRPWQIDDNTSALLSDTVGFIRRLPHHLVASFHATLEEARQARLLLHVVDSASPLAEEHIHSVNATLRDVGCTGQEMLYVFNKIDLAADRSVPVALAERYTPSVTVSAVTGEGLDTLREFVRVRAAAASNRMSLKLRFSAGDGRRLSALNSCARVKETSYEGESVIVRVDIAKADVERLRRLPGKMDVALD